MFTTPAEDLSIFSGKGMAEATQLAHTGVTGHFEAYKGFYKSDTYNPKKI
jgi:hypothetical protein